MSFYDFTPILDLGEAIVEDGFFFFFEGLFLGLEYFGSFLGCSWLRSKSKLKIPIDYKIRELILILF